MADNLGSIAWLFLPENEQVQYLQKIAQMRKKYLRPQIINDTDEAYFLHEVAIFTFYSIFCIEAIKLYGFIGFNGLCWVEQMMWFLFCSVS